MKTKIFCHAILQNDNKEILILKRNDNDDLYPGKWDLPGGFKEKDESFKDCVIRELKEETGLDIKVNTFENVKAQIYNGEIIVVLLYSVSCDNISKISLDNAHTKYKFIKTEQFTKEDFDKELIWYLKELYLELKKQTDALKKRKNLINYLFSCINTEIGFTSKQSSCLKKDIKQNSIITFIASEFDNYDKNDVQMNKVLNSFKDIEINFKKWYIIDNRTNKKEVKKVIDSSDVVYLMGGNPINQMDNIKNYNIEKLLKAYEGIVIGTSAGAMNQAKRVKYFDEINNLVDYDGIGLVDILIYPHLNIDSLENLNEVLKVSKYGKIYCLPNESFIKLEENNTVIEGSYYVLGE